MKTPTSFLSRTEVIVLSLLIHGGWASAATVATGTAIVRSSGAVTLNAYVHPQGIETTAWFRWGTTTNYGSTTPTTNLGSGTNEMLVRFNLAGLWPTSTYHYRAAAATSVSTNWGADVEFTTLSGVPSVTTLTATVLSAKSANLNGQVNPDGVLMTAWFDWGMTTNYGSTTTRMNLGSGTNAVLFSFNLTGLTVSNAYHYRVVASNSTSTSYGADVEFTMICPVVTSLADGGLGSLRQILADASAGARITFEVNGTITLTSGELVVNKDVELQGPGPDLLAVSGNHSSRVFNIGSNANARISGITIRDGQSANGRGTPDFSPAEPGAPGGGVFNTGKLTLSNCIIRANRTGSGGAGGYWSAGASGGDGAGLYSIGELSLFRCQFLANTNGAGGRGGNANYPELGAPGGIGGRGGGVYTRGTCEAFQCTIASNFSGAGGQGGTSSSDGGAGGDGSGMANEGRASLGDCTFSSNIGGQGGMGGQHPVGRLRGGDGGAGGRGGGIFNSGTLILTNCTFGENRPGGGGVGTEGNGGRGGIGGAGGSGGGIYSTGSVMLQNCTLAGNDTGAGGTGGYPEYTGGAKGVGGGVYVSGTPSLQLRNTIVACNTNFGSGSDVSGTFTSLAHNLIGITNGSSGFGLAGDLVGSTNSPLNAILGPLSNNGGPTDTHALLPGSPAIDAGGNTGAPAADQRGLPRGASIDIGAYERNTQPSISEIAFRPGQGLWLGCNIPPGTTGIVQISTNLLNWANFTNRVSDAGGWFEVIDSASTNRLVRFYRLRAP